MFNRGSKREMIMADNGIKGVGDQTEEIVYNTVNTHTYTQIW